MGGDGGTIQNERKYLRGAKMETKVNNKRKKNMMTIKLKLTNCRKKVKIFGNPKLPELLIVRKVGNFCNLRLFPVN